MRLLFICLSQEPGRCGVGDYTRRLAEACVERGVECAIVALNDRHLGLRAVSLEHGAGSNGLVGRCDGGVRVLRLAAGSSWDERVERAREFAREFVPDWVSLQFVPYGYHPRGFCWGLGPRVDAIAGASRRHVFFHELTLGLHREEVWKNRLQGYVQAVALRRVIRCWKPQVVHTHAAPYVAKLRSMGLPAEQMPLFGNIPIAEPGPVHSEFDAWVAKRGASEEKILLGGYFGGFYPGAANPQFVQRLNELGKQMQHKVVCFLAGRQSPAALQRWEAIAQQPASHVEWVFLGEMTPTQVSRYLQGLDFGIAATPYALVGKSASVADMLDHGLPVLVPLNDWTARVVANERGTDGLVFASDSSWVKDNAWIRRKKQPESLLNRIAERFLFSIRG